MANLRRARPDEQVAALKRFKEISLTHHRLSSNEQSSLSPSSAKELQHFQDVDNTNDKSLQDGGISPQQEISDFVFDQVGVTRLESPVSPNPHTRTSQGLVKQHYAAIQSSVSPVRKYVKRMSSPAFSLDKTRGQVPGQLPGLVPGQVPGQVSWDNTSQTQKLNVADRRWEKLRSILVAMKNQPFNVEDCLKTSPDLLVNLPGNMTTEELQTQLATLKGVLKQKKLQLQQTENERDSALAYIHHLKLKSVETLSPSESESKNKILRGYERGPEHVSGPNLSKENVLTLLAPQQKDLHKLKSYLDRLMAVILMRAPWILDEVDKVEISDCTQFVKSSENEVLDVKL